MPNMSQMTIGNVTYDLKDTEGRAHVVEVSNTKPVHEDNKIWIKDQENEYVVPSYDEFEDVKAAITKTGDAVGTEKNEPEMKAWGMAEHFVPELLNISDDNGNKLIMFDADGHFKTKGFNSERSVQTTPSYSPMKYNFAIRDEEGNVAFSILNGLAITNQQLYGKKLAIIGDSISTFEGWLPDGYPSYYPKGNLKDVENTWWKKLINELGLVLIRNASWSGSRVTGNSQDSRAFPGCSDLRVNALIGDNQETPDIIICYIGTNDWGRGIPVGTFNSHSEIPAEGEIGTISEAYAMMLYKLRTRYPKAQIYCVLLLEGRLIEGHDEEYPIINTNGETIHDVNHAIMEVAHIFGCQTIDLETSGIHYWNVSDYTIDRLHPNTKGAEIVEVTAKQTLLNTYHEI